MSIEVRLDVHRGSFHLDVAQELPGTGVSSIFGPSGCGKTTLLRAIAGLDRHPGAIVRVGGQTWQDESIFVPVHERQLGYVFQEAGLFPHLDVRGNIEYGLNRRSGSSTPSTELLSLLDLNTMLDRRPESLSGGERQRVAIARALAGNPGLLLMDEPLSSLDKQRKNELLPYLDRLHEELEIPVVHVSHSLRELQHLADYIVLLENGSVTASGPASDILTRTELAPARDDLAASIIDARVVAISTDYGLTTVEFPGGAITFATESLLEGDLVRLQVQARDVSVALEEPASSSILNIFPVRISQMQELGPAMVLLRLDADGTPLLARITRKSAETLKLEKGQTVFAQVKSVALLH